MGHDPEMSVKNSVTFPDVYSAGSTVDADSAADQAVLSVAATGNFDDTDEAKGWRVIIGRGTAREEEGTIASINAGVSITLDDNLTYAHTAAQADVVEVCWAALSDVIDKTHYKKIALFLPADWTTAAIEFLGCDTPDGTFLPVVKATDVAVVAIASVAASKAIGLDGIVMQGVETMPYLQLRSGVAATEVDQGNGNVEVNYILMR